ncbi:MAG: insulinase family protein, partial [Afipia sp.]|nr:insulinase family protein [Afipia sp.]
MTISRQFIVRAVAALGILCAPAAAQSAMAQATSQRPDTFTLSNGLQVVVIPDRRIPVVTQMIWYKVGSADETPGKSGLAHFLEHLMFKGTAEHPAGEFSQLIARIG